MGVVEDVEAALAAKFEVVLPHLDERQRRLVLAAEARALGHGGIRRVARAAGVREATVSAGVTELDSGVAPLGRVRRRGAGRKRVADTDPGLVSALLALVEPDVRGDPMSPLRWTTKSMRNLAGTLTAGGHRVGADTVASLLREQGFSLQGNAKTVEGKQNPDRDAQFRYINEQVKQYQADAQPVVSVDTKKKELVGEFKNAGREWRPAGDPVKVDVHDFPDKELGKVVPYGIYDLAANTGWVNVGIDHDTAAFAVESVRRWWNSAGQASYPHAQRLLITADAGGSNSYRTRAWKTELAALAAQTGLAITVCHFPPGTSKWNTIEHRLFSHITMNWRGRPLTSHEVILQTIAATTTRTGLTVHSELDTGTYPTGVTISNAQMTALPITRHDWHGDWNYTLHPETGDHTSEPNQPPPPIPVDTAILSDPLLTGLSRPELDTLTTALTALRQTHTNAHHHEHQRHRTEQGLRPHKPRPGRPPRLPFPDQILATILHIRLSLTPDTLAALFACRRSNIHRAIEQTRPLLDQHGTTIDPAALPASLTDLIKIKPAC
jgi:hypothetical protein